MTVSFRPHRRRRLRSGSKAQFSRSRRRPSVRPSVRPRFEQLEDRRLLATMSFDTYSADDGEVNKLEVTTDGDWLIINDRNPNWLTYLPGAVNPNLLNDLKVTVTGDANNHTTLISAVTTDPLVCEGFVVVVAGEGGDQTCFIDPLEIEGLLSIDPASEPNPDFDGATFGVDVLLSLFQLTNRLPEGDAIVPISPASKGFLVGVVGIEGIGFALTLKAADGAPLDTLGNLSAVEALLALSTIVDAVAHTGRITINAGDKGDEIDLSSFDRNATVDLGDGNDEITLGFQTDSVDGGSGNDTFVHNRGASGVTKTIDGGSGLDLLMIDAFEQSDEVTISFTGDNFTLDIDGTTTTYNLTDVEEIVLATRDGDDNVTITNVEQFSGVVKVDLGEGFDRISYDSTATEILLSANPFSGDGEPWPDTGFGLLTIDGGNVSEFAAIEEFELAGSAQTLSYNAPGLRGDIHVVGMTATTELHVDRESTIVIANGATTLNLAGRSGDDRFFINPAAGTSLTEINVTGSGLSGLDILVLEGTSGADSVAYTPGSDATSASLQFNAIAVNGSLIDQYIANGGGGSDTLVVNGTTGDDVIDFAPGATEMSGWFEVTSTALQYSPASFAGFDSREFNGNGGVDRLSASSRDLPDVNADVTVTGGSTATMFSFHSPGAAPTTFRHDADQTDVLAIELPTTHDVVDVTPGEGLQIAVDMGLGENTLIFHAGAGANVEFDLNARVISQAPTFGDVSFTGTHVVVDAAMQELTATHSNDDASVLTLEPTGPAAGEFSTADDFGPQVEFINVAQLNLTGDGTLEYIGSDFADAVNATQAVDNAVDFEQRVRKTTGMVDYVPVSASGYTTSKIFGGAGTDFFRIDVSQVLETSATNLLTFEIDGGPAKDELVVLDDGVGNTIVRRAEVDELSGFVQVGALPQVAYDRTEAVKVFPFDPVSGGTGTDLMGQEVVLAADPLEPNDNRLTASDVSASRELRRKLNIGTPTVDQFGNQVLADEDWFRFNASTTGVYRVALLFSLVGDPANGNLLPNGQPGLPDSGELDLVIYDEQGREIVNADDLPTAAMGGTDLENVTGILDVIGPSPSETVDENGNVLAGPQRGPRGKVVDVGIEQLTTIYIRVRGHAPTAMNAYDLLVLSPQELADGPIADPLGDGTFDPNDPDAIPDPPGGGLRITRVDINSFNPADLVDPDPMDPDVEPRSPALIFPPDPRIEPTFQVESITIHLEDFPPRWPGFQYAAIHESIAVQPGNYILEGVNSGPITIDAIDVVNDPVAFGDTATGTVTLRFNAPLPDDRFTLTIRDSLVDPGLRPLDGESNQLAPTSVGDYKSGNGEPGGDFVGKFTVDTRVEIASFFAGSFWIDLNQNGLYDPANPDPLNRDVVYQFGENGGLVDRPIVGDWNGDGYDEIGLYAIDTGSGTYRFRLDRNANGIFDPGPDPIDDPQPFTILAAPIFEGFPVAADWNGDGIDDLGLLATGQWYLDLNGDGTVNPATEAFPTNFAGTPFVGDWDGTGTPRVGTYDLNQQAFLLDMNNDKVFEPAIDWRIDWAGDGDVRPLVGDFDADFDTNIGLVVTNVFDATPGRNALWMLNLGDPLRNPLLFEYEESIGNPDNPFDMVGSPGNGIFRPAPTGYPGTPLVYQDILYQVLDPRFIALAGNFDLPATRVTPPASMLPPPPPPGNPLHNAALPADVNNSGTVTFGDLLEMESFLGNAGPQPIFPDVDDDGLITAQDYLAIWQHLSQFGEGESLAAPSGAEAIRGWLHNRFEPTDVDLNGAATPHDALAIANFVRAHGARSIDDVAFEGKFLDANRDDFVTPIDFLVVANHLRRNLTPLTAPAVAEGESANAPGIVGRVALTSKATPHASVRSDDGLPDAPSGARQPAEARDSVASGATAREPHVDVDDERSDDLESVLDAIAGDVGQVWDDA